MENTVVKRGRGRPKKVIPDLEPLPENGGIQNESESKMLKPSGKSELVSMLAASLLMNSALLRRLQEEIR